MNIYQTAGQFGALVSVHDEKYAMHSSTAPLPSLFLISFNGWTKVKAKEEGRRVVEEVIGDCLVGFSYTLQPFLEQAAR